MDPVRRLTMTLLTKLPIRIAGAALLAAACVQVAAATPPAIVAKQKQAAKVLAEISAIDEQLNVVSEQFDGARVRLQSLHARLRREQAAYARARKQYARAEQRAANLLVWLYTSNHSSSLDVILGASSLGELLRLSDDESAISGQAALIADQTEHAGAELRVSVRGLERDRAAAQATVGQLADRRAQIERGLSERRTLLTTVEAQVARLQAQERIRQERLAAQARARLAAEAAALARAQAEARAKAEAAARALAEAQARARGRAQAAARAAAAAAAARAAAAKKSALRAATDSSSAATTTTTTPATTTLTTTPGAATTTPGAAVTTTAQVGTDPSAVPSTPVLPTTDPSATTPTDAGTTTAPALAATPSGAATPALPLPPATPLPAGHPQAAMIVLQYIGVPYLWGGASPAGFDCSGLVAYVFAQLGITLPHFAAAQWTYGVPVPVAELQPGDLVFFNGLDHVGIYIGAGEFVDAPHTGAFVRIDMLSGAWYVSHYVGARRI